MNKRNLFIFCLTTLLGAFTAKADVRLPAIIGNHMVLQQKSEVKLWGWSDATEKIKISTSWDTVTYKTEGKSSAKWSVSIKTPAAGGPYKITIQGYNTIEIDDVLIGEVWDCSGQSNMEMHYGWGLKQYTSEVEKSANNSIRFFHIPRLTSQYPQDDLKGQWVVCSPESLKNFSLVGYFFGKKLNQELKVPVGLINASWGGTPAEVWTPKEVIAENDILAQEATKLKEAKWWPIFPAATFNGMINPITNYAIAGVIWYQGEANVGHGNTYQLLFSSMINNWRKAWNKDFPFYFVQIAPFSGYGNSISSALVREAQTKTLTVPNTGMIVIHDLVDNIKDIHPQNKQDVGLRLANYALAETYGKQGLAHKSPLYKSMKIEKAKIRISFENVNKGLIFKGTPTEFYIAGSDKVFVPASAKIDGSTVIVWNDDVKNPEAVRFGFTNLATPNLFSKEGLPAGVFRTDNWDDINTTK